MTFLSRQRWVAEVQIQPIRNLGAKREWVVNATPWPLYPPGKAPARVLFEARSAFMDADNLAPTGIRSSDRQVRSESLYRLRYPGRHRLRYQ